ncbi:hypothetical protein PTW37_06505 [Arthrobacter agilis]|uniref:hypothetical protein n=1 Tax=Arthrobacter agilis TaxID=37921 RepID=UPI002365437C|nr:hypothetical protein [Arthrobacter agilis]WDF34545.1 hypothetical protein PTW37_06505 [Arthrobacter agilis]
MAKVLAYSKTTGEPHEIPEAWLESKNPALNKFRKTPLTGTPAAEPKKKES